MPAYNAGRFLRTTLASVLAQTHRNLEVVLLDDASTDDTAEVALSFDDPRLTYVRNQVNLGQFRTMSRAVELTAGEYVAIYHSDDVYEPEIVQRELAFLQAEPRAGAVFAQDNIIDEYDHLLTRVSRPAEFRGRELLNYEDVFPYLMRNKNQLLCCPTFMARRQVLAEAGAFDAARYRIAADLDMWLRILRRHPVGVLDERLVNYRRSSAQESSKYRNLRKSQEEFFDIMDRYGDLDGWWPRLTARDRREYEFHRLDDRTFRAANHVILGESSAAGELLTGRFSWASMVLRPRRRKLRVLLLRTVMRTMLAVGAESTLGRLLLWSEYGAGAGSVEASRGAA
jgi:glycosyltransferase involved in cell wall biosynthesis